MNTPGSTAAEVEYEDTDASDASLKSLFTLNHNQKLVTNRYPLKLTDIR